MKDTTSQSKRQFILGGTGKHRLQLTHDLQIQHFQNGLEEIKKQTEIKFLWKSAI